MSKERSLLPMLLGTSALAIAMCGAGAYILARYLVKETRGVVQSLPRPSRLRAPTVESTDLGPMYPGSVRVEDSTDTISVDLPTRGSYQVLTADYFTQDSMAEAVAYYRHFFHGTATEHVEATRARWVQKTERNITRFVVLESGTTPETKDRLKIHLALLLEEE